jgi:hypothetical protein
MSCFFVYWNTLVVYVYMYKILLKKLIMHQTYISKHKILHNEYHKILNKNLITTNIIYKKHVHSSIFYFEISGSCYGCQHIY